MAGFVPLIGVLAAMLLQLTGVVFWILLMLASLQGKFYKVPYIGDIAEDQMRRL
ncbi:Chloroplast import component protein (Tic20) [compost metagenome]